MYGNGTVTAKPKKKLREIKILKVFLSFSAPISKSIPPYISSIKLISLIEHSSFMFCSHNLKFINNMDIAERINEIPLIMIKVFISKIAKTMPLT